MIIDCHCHAGKGDGFRGPWDTEAKIEPYLARAEAAGIDRTVVFPVFNSDYAAANARLAAIVRRHAPQLIGFAALNPARDRGRVAAMVGRAVESFGFRGLKVHGLDAYPGRELCEAARRYRIPVLVDVVRRTAAVEMLASQYPDVNFIIPHLGGFADDWMVHLQVVDQMVRYPNVHADTSGVRFFDALVHAVRRAGPHKLLFGSDGPQLHPGVELHKVRMLRLPPDAERLVMGGNLDGARGPYGRAPARPRGVREGSPARPGGGAAGHAAAAGQQGRRRGRKRAGVLRSPGGGRGTGPQAVQRPGPRRGHRICRRCVR